MLHTTTYRDRLLRHRVNMLHLLASATAVLPLCHPYRLWVMLPLSGIGWCYDTAIDTAANNATTTLGSTSATNAIIVGIDYCYELRSGSTNLQRLLNMLQLSAWSNATENIN